MSHESKTDQKLVYMANQIGAFFSSQKDMPPASAIAAHIRKFWDPRMRKRIVDMLDAGQAQELKPDTRAAIEIIKSEKPAAA